MEGGEAVSYTHLDVYKRQVESTLSKLRGRRAEFNCTKCPSRYSRSGEMASLVGSESGDHARWNIDFFNAARICT